MGHYWVSAIVQNKSDEKPWLLALNNSDLTIEEAKKNIRNIKFNNHVLSAWIDVFDENNNKQTVFHESYINIFGDINRSMSYEILCLEKPMSDCLLSAFKHHAIITASGLGSEEFVFVSKGKAYYEDGGCIGAYPKANEYFKDWSHQKWYILRYLSEDEVKIVDELVANGKCDSKIMNKILNKCELEEVFKNEE